MYRLNLCNNKILLNSYFQEKDIINLKKMLTFKTKCFKIKTIKQNVLKYFLFIVGNKSSWVVWLPPSIYVSNYKERRKIKIVYTKNRNKFKRKRGKTKVMNRKRQKAENERGITLIALIVVIILLVIISAVVIKAIAGDNGMIKETEAAVNDYKEAEYKEEITRAVLGVVQANGIRGEGTSLEDIERELLEENSTWVKNAVTNTDEEISNPDILVETVDRIHISNLL